MGRRSPLSCWLLLGWLLMDSLSWLVVCLVLLGADPLRGSALGLCLVDCLVGCRRLTVVGIVVVDCQKGSVLQLPVGLRVCHM